VGKLPSVEEHFEDVTGGAGYGMEGHGRKQFAALRHRGILVIMRESQCLFLKKSRQSLVR